MLTWSLKSRATHVRHSHKNQGLCHMFHFPAVCSKKTHFPLPLLNVSFLFKAVYLPLSFLNKQHRLWESTNYVRKKLCCKAWSCSSLWESCRICVLTRSWNYCIGNFSGTLGSKEMKMKITSFPFLLFWRWKINLNCWEIKMCTLSQVTVQARKCEGLFSPDPVCSEMMEHNNYYKRISS